MNAPNIKANRFIKHTSGDLNYCVFFSESIVSFLKIAYILIQKPSQASEKSNNVIFRNNEM
jgi:hypothetical protein